MPDNGRRNMSWGEAILAGVLIYLALVLFFAVGPSQFLTTVNKSYARIPTSGQTRFIRDAVTGSFYMIIVGWLAVGAYQIQGMARRNWRIIGITLLLGIPTILFCIAPAIVHGLINTYVSSRPLEDQAATLYTLDEWVYTLIVWGGALGITTLLTPAWFVLPKRLEARAAGESRTSAFGRPVVSPT